MAGSSPETVLSLPGIPSLRTGEESRFSPSAEFPRHSRHRSTGGQRDRETRGTSRSTLRPQGGGDCRAPGRSGRRSRRSLSWYNWREGRRSRPALGGTHRTWRHLSSSLSDWILRFYVTKCKNHTQNCWHSSLDSLSPGQLIIRNQNSSHQLYLSDVGEKSDLILFIDLTGLSFATQALGGSAG